MVHPTGEGSDEEKCDPFRAQIGLLFILALLFMLTFYRL